MYTLYGVSSVAYFNTAYESAIFFSFFFQATFTDSINESTILFSFSFSFVLVKVSISYYFMTPYVFLLKLMILC